MTMPVLAGLTHWRETENIKEGPLKHGVEALLGKALVA